MYLQNQKCSCIIEVDNKSKQGKRKMTITDKEQQVITYMEKFDNKGWFDQEGWFFPEDMRVEGMNQHELGGVLSSLEKKNIVTFEDGGMVILTKVWEA